MCTYFITNTIKLIWKHFLSNVCCLCTQVAWEVLNKLNKMVARNVMYFIISLGWRHLWLTVNQEIPGWIPAEPDEYRICLHGIRT